jgi:hypothetical protein
MLKDVGTTAGKVFQKLETGGSMSMSRLKKEVGGNETLVTMAIGWLAREGKIKLAKERNSLKIELNGQ